MSDWSIQRIEQIAPDASAFKAAQGTAKPAKWQNLGSDERLVWGECQGSGSTPYQVRADLVDATYKCSCPSRKLPCKHTLGLLLMLVSGAVKGGTAPPEFVIEWSANRAKRAEAKEARAAKGPAAEPDKEAQAKRIEKRESRVAAGLEQLEVWLTDIVVQGLATTRAQGESFWTQMATRLVDAQAPGLARRVRDLGERAVASMEWQSELLSGVASLQLLIDGYRAQDRLPADLAAEVRSMIGWTQDQESLRQRDGIRDHWQVVGRRQVEEDALRTQMTWLHGAQSGRFALILEFAVGSQPLPANYTVAQSLDMELVFFDGSPALRALEKERHGLLPRNCALPGPQEITALQAQYSRLLAMNPWLERMPFVLGPVRPIMSGNRFALQDSSGRVVPAAPNCKHAWELMSLSSGREVILFGEWNGRSFDPYCVQYNTALFTLARLADLPLLASVA